MNQNIPDSQRICDVDGDPHEVAEVGIQQAIEFLDAYEAVMEQALTFAANAWQTVEYHRTGEMPSRSEFLNVAQGARYTLIQKQIAEQRKTLGVLKAAASYNPRSV